MRPNISELSYGYALIDELIHWRGTNLTAAPVFPSLYQEGQTGGGYDVMLQRPGIPLFLQFKLSHCMVRINAQEAQDGLLQVPYYRMHLRPLRHSSQHEMLLELENSGNEVYYSAPAFHRSHELNEAYLNHRVRDESIWVSPSAIGPLSDDGDHYIAFRLNGPVLFRSEPQKIDNKIDFDAFTGRVQHSFESRSESALSTEELTVLVKNLTMFSEKRTDIARIRKKNYLEKISKRPLIEQIALYAQVFLDCQLFLVTKRS